MALLCLELLYWRCLTQSKPRCLPRSDARYGYLLVISFAILDYFGETNHIVPIVPRQPQLR